MSTISAPSRESQRGAPVHSRSATGDLFLSFGGQELGPTRGRVGSAWQRTAKGAEWALWQQEPTPEWRGFPVARISRGEWSAWLLGELYGLERPIEEVVAAVIEGDRRASDLNGNFLLFAWSQQTRTWRIWTSRYGTLHAYYGSNAGRVCLGTSYAAVLNGCEAKAPNLEALAAFLSFGFYTGSTTLLENVSILRPATEYVIDGDGGIVSEERYWQWEHKPDTRRSYLDSVAEFADIMRRIVKEYIREGNIALPISGGLDSRVIAAAMPAHAGSRVWSYSYGYSANSIETQIASEVAAARHLRFQSYTVPAYLAQRIDRVIASTEGFQDVTQSRQAGILEDLAQQDVVLGGHLGDLWLDDIGLMGRSGVTSDSKVLEHALKKIRKRGHTWLLEHLIYPRMKPSDVEDLLRQQVNSELQRLAHLEDPDFRVKAFKVDQWVFRWTNASLRMYQAAVFPRLPFYDNRLGDFVGTLPTASVAGRRLEIDYLKRFAPDLARIQWQKFGTNLNHLRYFQTLLVPQRAVRKGLRLLRGTKVLERNWEVQLLGPEGKGLVAAELLTAGRRIHDLVAPAKVRELVDNFYREPLSDGRGFTVSMLLTLSSALERLR